MTSGPGRLATIRAIGRDLVREWNEDRVAGLAAETAFWSVLSLFPALLTVTGLLGVLQDVTGGDVADRAEDRVIDFLQRILTDEAEGTITAVRELFEQASPGVLTFGLAAAVWSLSRGFAAVIRALDVAYDVEAHETRSWWRLRAIGLGLGLGTVLTSVVILALLVLGPLFGTGEELADLVGAGDAAGTVWDLVRLPVVGLVLLAWATTIFHFGPAAHQTPWHWDLPGSLTTALLAGLASVGMRTYLDVAAGGNQVFGVLGGALVVMLWFYLLSLSLLVGAELNAILAVRWLTSDGVEGRPELPDEAAGLGGPLAVEDLAHDGGRHDDAVG